MSMQEGMTIDLPWPPKELSPNSRVHWAKRGKAAKAYRSACWILTKARGIKVEPGLIPLHITFYPPDKRHRDDDNMVSSFKAGRDGVADGLYIDDRNFVTSIAVGEPVKGGLVRINIGENAESST